MSKALEGLTDEQRAALTPEELAGMEEGEDFEEGGTDEYGGDGNDAGNTAGADTNGAAAGNEDGKITNAADDTAAAEAADAGQNQAAADQGDAGTTNDDATAPARVSFDAQLPEDFDDQMKKITDGKDALAKEFEEGDIGASDYQKRLDELNREERGLERIKDRVEYDTSRRYDRWVNVEVAGFMDKFPQYRENQMLNTLLDQEVRKLQARAENDTDPSILQAAHKAISKALPAMFQAPTQEQQRGKGKEVTERQELPTGVPNLSRVPASDVDKPGEGKFAWLDTLSGKDPMKFESELAKMSDSERNEYLSI